jgi:DNA/RNA-binding domain of Phe-tRNA-synthetase-like protein
MMQFIVDPAIFERFPGLLLPVAVAGGIENQRARPAITARWQEVWAQAGQAGASYGNAQSHPRVRPWRERFTAMGVSGKEFPSSAEALLRRALKGGEPFSINPLVDWYNAISLRYFVPAGGFDLASIHGPLELRLSRPGDMFLSLDADEPVEVPPGEVSYTDGQTVLTRHFVWRQARAGLIAPGTREVFLVSEVLGEVGPEVAEQVRDAFKTGLQENFGVDSETFLLDAQHPAIAW